MERFEKRISVIFKFLKIVSKIKFISSMMYLIAFELPEMVNCVNYLPAEKLTTIVLLK